MNVLQIMLDVNNPVRTWWAPISAAVRLDTNWTMTEGAVVVSVYSSIWACCPVETEFILV